MTKILAKSFKDILSPTVLLFVLKVTLLSLLATIITLWLVGESINSFVSGYLTWIPWEWLQTTGASVASIAMSYMVFIIMLSIVTSLMVEPLLIQLAQKHYPDTKVVGSPNITTSLRISLQSALMMLVIFLFTFPMMFVPLIGAVYMLWLWAILLKNTTIYDVSALFIADKNTIKQHTKGSTILAMVASGFNYIPLLNIFAAVFGQILFLHKILGEDSKKKIRIHKAS